MVLGAAGMLGAHVVKAFHEDKNHFTVILHAEERFSNSNALEDYLSTLAPSSVINCMGYLGNEPGKHFHVNGCLPRVIADWCEKNRALFIHISTNAVFSADETRHWYPHDRTNPITPYEISKAFGEDPRAYIIRASFIGKSPKGLGLLHNLCLGKPYLNRKWNGVTALILARRIVEIVVRHRGSPTRHLEHVHSPDMITLVELAKLIHSTSQCIGEAPDTKLLGGGIFLPPIAEQIAMYQTITSGMVIKSL